LDFSSALSALEMALSSSFASFLVTTIFLSCAILFSASFLSLAAFASSADFVFCACLI